MIETICGADASLTRSDRAKRISDPSPAFVQCKNLIQLRYHPSRSYEGTHERICSSSNLCSKVEPSSHAMLSVDRLLKSLCLHPDSAARGAFPFSFLVVNMTLQFLHLNSAFLAGHLSSMQVLARYVLASPSETGTNPVGGYIPLTLNR